MAPVWQCLSLPEDYALTSKCEIKFWIRETALMLSWSEGVEVMPRHFRILEASSLPRKKELREDKHFVFCVLRRNQLMPEIIGDFVFPYLSGPCSPAQAIGLGVRRGIYVSFENLDLAFTRSWNEMIPNFEAVRVCR